jgi:hypothetical protein
MEDPTNQYSSSRADVTIAVPQAAEAAGTAAPPKPPRALDTAAWLANAAARGNCLPLARIAAGKNSPLLWGAESLSVDTASLLAKIQRAALASRWKNDLAGDLQQFVSQPISGDVTADRATMALAWAYLFPAIAKSNQPNAAELLKRLFEVVDATPANTTASSALPQLLAKVELPLLLAPFAPDAKLATSLRKGAIGAESRLAGAWLDPFGLPTQNLAELLRPWLATLLRTHELLRGTDQQFSDTARERLERLGRHVLRLSRPDGGSILHTAAGSTIDREFLTAAVMATTSTAPIALLALGKGVADKKPVKGMPAAPLYSPKSSLAVLRNRWAAPPTQATVDFSGPQVWLDVSCGNQSLLHGHWDVAVRVNDVEATPLGPWTEVCWHSDADCDYLEIEQKLSGGWLLQRHILLARQDECLLLADSLLDETKRTPAEFMATTAEAPRLDYATNLQLSPEVSFLPQKESREGHLQVGRKPLALVLPLALPEWRKQAVTGELSSSHTLLQHRLQTRGRNLFSPLWLDLNPTRFKGSQSTWRQLTIGEFLHVQPREVAVGFRVQVHYSQWLLYRSLAWRGNRTVLGKNYATDFACCRFQPNGETQEILEVQ